MSTAAKTQWSFGESHGRFESPDLLLVTFRGTLDVEGAKQVVEMYREAASRGPVFVLVDLTGSGVEPAARTHLAQNVSPDWFHAMVGYGAGFAQKAVLKSLVIGASLFGKAAMELEFVTTEAEGRAAIERRRGRLRAKVA
ncbi:hypothetical protein KRR26_18710 [Corallococcus sp. M34]|uniref:hypothetical protein n=1 Tax=Citreicoccus inhibens TaxID=2849499 RepID=UPI0011C369A7|nr:hypothetical protein [Citreicoccus inhibens]MBU8897652.1 hypothetical protein [Citreicoccus inhibens]